MLKSFLIFASRVLFTNLEYACFEGTKRGSKYTNIGSMSGPWRAGNCTWSRGKNLEKNLAVLVKYHIGCIYVIREYCAKWRFGWQWNYMPWKLTSTSYSGKSSNSNSSSLFMVCSQFSTQYGFYSSIDSSALTVQYSMYSWFIYSIDGKFSMVKLACLPSLY